MKEWFEVDCRRPFLNNSLATFLANKGISITSQRENKGQIDCLNVLVIKKQ